MSAPVIQNTGNPVCGERSELRSASHVGVFRALPLGAMICAIPALRVLRALAPSAMITLIGAPWAATFVTRFSHYLDRFVPFPGHPDLDGHADRVAFNRFAEDIRPRFDWLIQLHGGGHLTNAILAHFSARHRAGFVSHPDAVDQNFISYPAAGHESERLLALMRHLGGHGTLDLEWSVTESDRMDLLRQPWRTALAGEPYVVVDMESCRGDCWRRPGIGELIGRLAGDYAVVMTDSSKDVSPTDGRTIHAQPLGLGALGALVADAKMVIGSESGCGHIATALSVPSLTIALDSDPIRWCRPHDMRHPSLDGRFGVDADHAWALICQALHHNAP